MKPGITTKLSVQKSIMKILFFLLISFFFNITSHAQFHAGSHYEFVGAGARQAGMGHAFIGLSDDVTAITSNPAGLSQLRTPEIVLDGLYTNYLYVEDWDDQYKNINHSYILNHLGFVLPINIGNKNLTLGLSYQNQFNENMKSERERNMTEEGNTDVIIHNNNIKTNILSAALAYNLTSWLSLGFTANKWFSSGKLITELDYFTWDFIWSYKVMPNYTGYNYIAGVLLNFEHINNGVPLKIGLKYNTAFVLENDQKSEVTSHVDQLEIDQQIKYEFPEFIGIGLSYRISDFFTVAADYEIRQFKDKEVTQCGNSWSINSSGEISHIQWGEGSYNMVQSNADLNQFRIGAEYILTPAFALIPIRLGFKSNPTIFADRVDSESTDQVKGNSYNAGSGIIFNKFSIDLSYERFSYSVKNHFSSSDNTNTYNIRLGFINTSVYYHF